MQEIRQSKMDVSVKSDRKQPEHLLQRYSAQSGVSQYEDDNKLGRTDGFAAFLFALKALN